MTDSTKKDEREAYLKALDKIDDLEMFVILAQKIDKLSKQGRINDIRRTLVISFVSLLESAKAEAEIAGRLSERAWAYKNMRDHGTEAIWVEIAKNRYEKLKAQQEKK